MFGLGFAEFGIIALTSVLLFGSRLPSAARNVGRSLMEFRRGFLEVGEECRKIEGEVLS